MVETLVLVAALFGLGTGVNLARQRRLGGRPLLLGLAAWLDRRRDPVVVASTRSAPGLPRASPITIGGSGRASGSQGRVLARRAVDDLAATGCRFEDRAMLRFSMTSADDEVLCVSDRLFDGLYEYRQALLLGRAPA